MNRIKIYYWHSDNLKPYQKQKLKDMGMYEEDGGYYVNLTPAEFVDKWQGNVILLAPNNIRKDWIVGITNVILLAPNNIRKDWIVGITGHHNFNQR